MKPSELLAEHKTLTKAARAAGVARSTFAERLYKEQQAARKLASIPVLPSREEPVSDTIARNCKRFERHAARRKVELWLPITLPENDGLPFGVAWFGDPHLDDEDCNWPLLTQHVDACRDTEGLYGACVGDFTNNWVGRLVREYAKQEVSKTQGRELAKWFLRDCGINWALCLIGNHDEWNEGDAILGLIADKATYLAAWEAKIEFRAGGQKWRVHASHDFPGTSIYNRTHGPSRAAMFSGAAAELYVCGHRHNCALQAFEHSEANSFVHAIRTRGYKWHDHYATVKGFSQGSNGATIVTIFDPQAETAAGRIMTFADALQGAQVLKALREQRRREMAPAVKKPKRKAKGKGK